MTVVDELFPEIDPKAIPLGPRVLVQLKSPMKRTKGGLIVPELAQETEKENLTVAKVIRLGALAFRHRETMAWWPENDPDKEGSFPVTPGLMVRVPRYGGDRWRIEKDGVEGLFVMFHDTDIGAIVDGDLSDFKTFY